MKARFLSLALVALVVGSSAQATAADAPVIPEVLEPWVPWVFRDDPTFGCPQLDGSRFCAWPGRLELELGATGGTFRVDVRVDHEMDIALPGDEGLWPRDVLVDGRAGLLRRVGNTPSLRLSPGTHRVSGRFSWTRLPGAIPLPRSIAMIDLKVDGRSIAQPSREASGVLLLEGLGSAGAVMEQQDSLSIEVHRRVDDGVPVQLTTRLSLRVSGKSREVDLGAPLPEGFEAVSITSSLPTRLDEGGHLRTQLRPGSWNIELRSRSIGPVQSLDPPGLKAPWPTEEIWVFSGAPSVRAVQLSGVPGIDPQRTSLPQDWHGLPAYLLSTGDQLLFDELRRGEAEPSPDSIEINRELWLSGKEGFIVQDRLRASLNQGGRLSFLSPGELGHVKQDGQDRVITRLEDGSRGVEVRGKSVGVIAESFYPSTAEIPAVGWDRHASALSASLNLPPGWELLAALGVDSAPTTWIERWTLLDVFFLLVLGLAFGQTLGYGWAALALFILGLSWHEPDVPRLGWLLLIGLAAISSLELNAKLDRLVSWSRFAVLAILGFQLVLFCWGQVRTGLFPQLEENWQQSFTISQPERVPEFGVAQEGMLNRPYGDNFEAGEGMRHMAVEEEVANSLPSRAPRQKMVGRKGSSYSKKKAKQRAKTQDPSAIVQTGPGIPSWRWRSHILSWSGPVSPEHSMRLVLLPPWADSALSLFRVLGLVFLLLRLGDPRKRLDALAGKLGNGMASASAQGLVVGMILALPGLLAPPSAQAQGLPDAATLEALRSHLKREASCGEGGCVEVPHLYLKAQGAKLRVEAEVHVVKASAWRLPGPSSAWMPGRVTVDGVEVRALRRDNQDFLALRLSPGHHKVVVTGPAPADFSLRFPLRPRTMSWDGADWSIEGYRPDEAPPPSVTLRRAEGLDELPEDTVEDETAEAVMEPWLELRRELDVGIPWLVHNELRRLGPSRGIVHARVPLLQGESVTSSGVPVEEGQAVITLQEGESTRSWESTLEESARLTMTAPTDRPWMEVWELTCAPIWACDAQGLAPTRHIGAGKWSPSWQPWPGESVVFQFSKPEAAQGATTTIDMANLTVRPGRRVQSAELEFRLRSSQGGEHSIKLPPGAEVQSFVLDGREVPVEVKEGVVGFSAQPTSQVVGVKWREEIAAGFRVTAPQVTLDSDVVNASLSIIVPDNKWLLWAGGPSWGAVVTLWQYVIVLLLAGWLLGRFAPTPLGHGQWFLLGLGMTQVPLGAPIVVVLWLVALGVRGRHKLDSWWLFNLRQASLVGMTLLAGACVFWAVSRGLLMQPDMQVEGAGSHGSTLKWFAQQSSGALPTPWVIWLPLWIWRVAMLGWALWLAIQLFRWSLWGWKQFTAGGAFMTPPPSSRGGQAKGQQANQAKTDSAVGKMDGSPEAGGGPEGGPA